ncbi:MAG: hypothetical protein F6K18_01340 [Okeania sp. SIO2C2]|nr:hypothetical protein [Okeania sp. SIO2C2]NEP85573.1 hypothetical protein [Okeania sp. SIO2C2]
MRYLGFAEKVLWMSVGDRRQETGDRRKGVLRGGRSKNCKNNFSAQL